ncbi:MAG: hypothetical protein DCC75_13915, partial [Proteobacteria bacterium]
CDRLPQNPECAIPPSSFNTLDFEGGALREVLDHHGEAVLAEVYEWDRTFPFTFGDTRASEHTIL